VRRSRVCWLGGCIVLPLVLSSVERAVPRQDSLPSFSCATFPAEASEAYLAARFGADNVATGPVLGF